MAEWNLVFRAEDREAKERVRWIEASLRQDVNVVEVTEYGIGSPNCTYLKVEFVHGMSQPQNRALHHLDQIHGVEQDNRNAVSSLDMLLGDELDQL